MIHIKYLSKFKEFLDRLLFKFHHGLVTRLFVVFVVIFFIFSTYFFVINYLQGVVVKQNSYQFMVDDYYSELAALDLVVNRLKVCIKAKENNDDISEWYCLDAISSYKKVMENSLSYRELEMVDKNAFESMILDLENNSFRINVLLNSRKESPSDESIILDFLWSYKMLSIIFIFIFLVFIYIYSKFLEYKSRNL